MKRIPKVIYKTPEEIDARIEQLLNEALSFPPSSDETRRRMHEIAKLRIYADAKRWMRGSCGYRTKDAYRLKNISPGCGGQTRGSRRRACGSSRRRLVCRAARTRSFRFEDLRSLS